MAAGFDGDTANRLLKSGLTFGSASTACLWVKFNALSSYDNIIALNLTGSSDYALLQLNSAANAIQIAVRGGAWSTGVGSAVSTGVWYHLAFVHSGTSNTMYRNGVSDGTAVGARDFNEVRLGPYSDSGTFYDAPNCSIAAVKVWDAALSVAQIQQEMWRFLPQRTANIVAFYPFLAENDFADYSGNGNGLTESGTVTHVADPPITWGAPSRRIIIPASAATTPQTKTLNLNALIQKQDILATAQLGALVQKQGITATTSLDAQVMAEQLVTAALNALLKAEGITASTDLNALIQAAINQTLSLDSVIDLQMSHHWRFENGFTDSAGSWNLTAVNSPGFTQGAPNKKAGLDLVGASDQLAWSDNDFTGAPALTVTGWFKATGAATLYMLSVRSNPAIAANDIQLQIASVADGRIAISIETNDTTETFFSTATTEEYNTDEWTYLALVFDGSATNVKLYASKPPYSTLELWIDETTAGGTISEPAAGPGDIGIGGGRGTTINTWNTANSWDGELDDIRTYPGVLDSTELAAVRDEVQGSLLIPSLDALIQALATDTVNLDALIQAAAIATAQLDGLIKVEGATVTTDLGALLQATQSVTTDLDALLQARQTETTDLGALLLKALSVSTALDAVLIETGVTTETTSLDALIKALGLTVTTGLDANIQTSASESASLDAMIQAQASLTASLSAVLKREGVTVSSSVDGLISAALTRSASLNALVQVRQALATSLDAVLVLGVNFIQTTLDALIQAKVTTSTGLDALILPFIRPEHVTYLTGVLRQVSNIKGTRIAQSNLEGEIDDSD